MSVFCEEYVVHQWGTMEIVQRSLCNKSLLWLEALGGKPCINMYVNRNFKNSK